MRYQHASELMADLKRLSRDTNSGIVAIPADPDALSATTAARTSSRASIQTTTGPSSVASRPQWGLWVGLAAVLAIVLLGFGFWSGRLVGFHSSKSAPVTAPAPTAAVTAPAPVTNTQPPAEKPSPSSPATGAPSNASPITEAAHPAPQVQPVHPHPAPTVATPQPVSPAAETPEAATPLPPSSSRTATLTLHDSARNREIPLKVYYPGNISGSLPLIIFSHGYGGTREGYEYLGRGWADAGYIVIFPTHIGSDTEALAQLGLRGAGDPAASFQMQQQRTADVHFILSSLKLIDQQVREIHGKINNKQIGVGGHSMGAGTALLVGGATASPPNASAPSFSFRDKHVRAVIAISPQGAGEEGFSDHSWDHIAVPTLTMSGTKDRGIGGQPPEWRTQPFQHMPAGSKYQVIVGGADHLSFAVGGRFRDCILLETIAFWDNYLKGQEKPIQTSGACAVSSR